MSPLRIVSIIGVLALSACSNGGDKPGATKGIDVTESEYAVSVATGSAPAGKVTFTVHNTGTMPHEIVVMKTDNPQDALPLEKTESKAVEDGQGNSDVGEVEDVDPGKTKSGTFDLAPGHYVLLCNVVGHYKLGMRTAFTVT